MAWIDKNRKYQRNEIEMGARYENKDFHQNLGGKITNVLWYFHKNDHFLVQWKIQLTFWSQTSLPSNPHHILGLHQNCTIYEKKKYNIGQWDKPSRTHKENPQLACVQTNP